MTAMLSQDSQDSDWPRIIRPTPAAKTGFTLMNIPKKPAGTRRRARRSASSGTAEDSTPAVAAKPSAASVGGWRSSTTTPTGT